jgi:hypothetical protein
MNVFQVITVMLSALTLLGAIIGVYIKLKIDITRIDTCLKFVDKEMMQKEITMLRIEKINREDHEKILDKIDKILINK